MRTRSLARRTAFVVFVALAIGTWRALPAAQADKMYSVTYSATDLPVYRLDKGGPKFAPHLLIEYLKREIDPKSWTEGDGAIASFPNNLSLVITQTETNHRKITSLLDQMRPSPEQGQRAADRY